MCGTCGVQRGRKYHSGGGAHGGLAGGVGTSCHDKLPQQLTCPAVYQKEKFMFLCDFFMCRARTSSLGTTTTANNIY